MLFISTSWRMGGTSLEWAIYHCYAGTEQCCEGFNVPRTSAPFHLPAGARDRFLSMYPDYRTADAGRVLEEVQLADGSCLSDEEKRWAERSLDFISGLDGVVVAKVVHIPNLVSIVGPQYHWVLLNRGFVGYQLSLARLGLVDRGIHARAANAQSAALQGLFATVDRLRADGVIRTADDAAVAKTWLAYSYHTLRAASLRGLPVFWLERRDVDVGAIASHVRRALGPEARPRLEDELREPTGWFPKLGGPRGRSGWLSRTRRYDPELERYYRCVADQTAGHASLRDSHTDEVCRWLVER